MSWSFFGPPQPAPAARPAGPPRVAQVLRFGGASQRDGKLAQLGARPSGMCPFTRRQMWKTQAGVALRASQGGWDVEVLSSCSC